MDRSAVISAAGQVIGDVYVGVLSTVDAHGQPHGRYMGAVMSKDGGWLYALSAKETRKVEHIRRNARVCWSFMRHDGREAVALYGQASVHETTVLPDDAWYHLSEFVEPYRMNAAKDEQHHAFVALVTKVTAIEYLNPGQGVNQPERVSFD